MSQNLVIVESPAKAKTIKKYLGKGFEVLASYGHVRDLVPKEGAVDPEHDFAMKYQLIERNEKHVDAIAKALKKAGALYLATDPDREGEAISWHLYRDPEGARRCSRTRRCTAWCSTRSPSAPSTRRWRIRGPCPQELVNAQQARRALDYLVGFNLSPLLWKKIRRGLSAGRVQSPALRLICEREDEIEKFKSEEYWTIAGESREERPGLQRRAFTSSRARRLSSSASATRSPRAPPKPPCSSPPTASSQVASVEKKQRTPQPGRALHHLHPATGSLAQAGLRRPAHHAHRPAAV